MTDKQWEVIKNAAVACADGMDEGSKERNTIFKALNWVTLAKPRVKVEVLGGCADVTYCTNGVNVVIQDHDNEATGH